MNKGRTRSRRGQLLLEAEQEFLNFKDELINAEVSEIAVNVHGVLSTISAKYTNDAIIDLIPEITNILNKFDASLKVNNDLKLNLTELAKENNLLLNSLKLEKTKRQQDFEESLNCEEKADNEIKNLTYQVENYEQSFKKMKLELKSKDEIINILKIDYERASEQLKEKKNKERRSMFLASKSQQTIPTDLLIQPIQLSNRFEMLDTAEEDAKNVFTTIQPKKKNKLKQNQYSSIKPDPSTKLHSRQLQQKIIIPFKHVTVIGDSHTRHLASIITKKTSRQTKTIGVCKPGAGLLDIMSSSSTTPGCTVLMAGTNDVAGGRQDIVFKHFERALNLYRRTSTVLVCPLPPRHDLPTDSSVHDVIDMVNQYIAELCIRCEGVELLDTGGIRRRHYTAHGMHLNSSGKHLLSTIILEKLSTMCPPRPRLCPAIDAAKPSTSTPLPSLPCDVLKMPRTLQHDTYADAVKHLSPPRGPTPNQSSVFLGTPLPTTIHN